MHYLLLTGNPQQRYCNGRMFNKLFSKILDSSVWLESDTTRIVWFTFLASMDEQGFCQFAAVGNLAQRAIVSIDKAKEAVKILESPDPDSSDPSNEGRRIERVDGGWIVLNAPKYRDIVTRAVAQEKTRQRVAAFRARKKQESHPCNADVTVPNVRVTQSEAEAEAEADTKARANTNAHAHVTQCNDTVTIPPDSDISVKAIAKAHPKFRKPIETERAIVEQLDRLGTQMGVMSAINYLLDRTLAYAKAFSAWPKDRQEFSPESPRWFRSACFAEADSNPQVWEQPQNGKTKKEERIDAIIKNL